MNWNPPLYTCGESTLPVCGHHMWTCETVIKRWLCAEIKCLKRVQTKQGLNYIIKESLSWRNLTKKARNFLNLWEIIVSVWERKTEFVCASLALNGVVLNVWDLRALCCLYFGTSQSKHYVPLQGARALTMRPPRLPRQGSVCWKPRKHFGPAKLFLINLYLNTERFSLKLLVWWAPCCSYQDCE